MSVGYTLGVTDAPIFIAEFEEVLYDILAGYVSDDGLGHIGHYLCYGRIILSVIMRPVRWADRKPAHL